MILEFVFDIVNEFVVPVSFRFLYNVLRRTGDDLLFRALRRSTIGTISFHFQVRDGAGWDTNVITTSSSKNIILFCLGGITPPHLRAPPPRISSGAQSGLPSLVAQKDLNQKISNSMGL